MERKHTIRMPLRYLMSEPHREFVHHLARASLSEAAMAVAHVLMRVLNFEHGKSFSVYASAQEAGLSILEFRRATEELIDVGALKGRKTVFLGDKHTLYRLGKPFRLRYAPPAAVRSGECAG